MDQQSQIRLDEITAQDPNAITEADALFLRARSSYLTEDQRVRFAAALKPVVEVSLPATEPAAEEETEAPKKKSAK